MICKENSIIVIVTYNPEASLWIALRHYKTLADHVIIVDNGSSESPKLDEPNIEIIYSKENKGIAWGLNVGIHKALSYNPEWIITFDQDSIPAENIWEVYNDVLAKYNGRKTIGLMCGGFALETDKALLPAQWKESIVLITSGMAHHVSVFEKVGLYNEAMFIDNVDFEYVMRTSLAGFATLRVQNDVIRHKIGSPLVKKIGPFTVESSNHNEFRIYYQGRNQIYLTRQFLFKFPSEILNFNYYLFCKVFPRMLLVERPLRSKLCALFKGFRDGFRLD